MPRRFPIYKRLLFLYPPGYRRRYGGQMLAALDDALDDQQSASGRAGVWLRAWLDLPVSMCRENVVALRGGLAGDTPAYIKLSALTAAALMLPFILIVSAHLIAHAVDNQTLYDSWLWRPPVLKLWALILPAAALALAAASYLIRVIGAREQQLWSRLFDFRHAWPVMLAGAFAAGALLFILFHDSTHCVPGNPVRELENWRGTWQCLQQG